MQNYIKNKSIRDLIKTNILRLPRTIIKTVRGNIDTLNIKLA